MRSDSTLRSLTPDQLDDLFDWIGTYSIRIAIERAAKPAPDGFNLRLHKNTLVRFFKAEERKRHAQELAELALVDEGAPEIAKLIKAAKVDFAHSVYELARCVNSESFARLESALHRIERCEIDREKVGLRKEEIALHRERLAMDRLHGEFSIASELLKSAPEYMDLRKRDDIHDENKVWLARERAFGVSPLAPFPRSEADRHPPQPGSTPSLTSLPSVEVPSAALNQVHLDTLIHANGPGTPTPTSLVSLSDGAVDGSEACHVSGGGNSPASLPSFPSTLIHTNLPVAIEISSSPSEHLRPSVESVDPNKSDSLEPENLQPAPGGPIHSDTLIHANAQNEPVSPSSLPSLPSVEGPAPSAGEDAGGAACPTPPAGDSASRSAAPGYFARFP